MRIVFATDLHGSEKCFRKFINSAPFYKADVLVLGGDITGKAICCIVEQRSAYRAELFGREYLLESEQALREFEEKVRFNGFYPYRCDPDEVSRLADDQDLLDEVFVDAMLETKRSWVEWADERLERYGVECFAITGNDDSPEVDKVFGEGRHIHLINGRRVQLMNWKVFGYPVSNRTPWDSPREKDEADIARDLIEGCGPDEFDNSRLILNVHAPPYGSGLDLAPELTQDLTPVLVGGSQSMIPVGSRAVREFIERYQPLLSLNGHVHESKGVVRIGRTLCINAGSRYNEGALQAAIIDLNGDEVKSYQLVTG